MQGKIAHLASFRDEWVDHPCVGRLIIFYPKFVAAGFLSRHIF